MHFLFRVYGYLFSKTIIKITVKISTFLIKRIKKKILIFKIIINLEQIKYLIQNYHQKKKKKERTRIGISVGVRGGG